MLFYPPFKTPAAGVAGLQASLDAKPTLHTAADEAAMVALSTAQVPDLCWREDEGQLRQLQADDSLLDFTAGTPVAQPSGWPRTIVIRVTESWAGPAEITATWDGDLSYSGSDGDYAVTITPTGVLVDILIENLALFDGIAYQSNQTWPLSGLQIISLGGEFSAWTTASISVPGGLNAYENPANWRKLIAANADGELVGPLIPRLIAENDTTTVPGVGEISAIVDDVDTPTRLLGLSTGNADEQGEATEPQGLLAYPFTRTVTFNIDLKATAPTISYNDGETTSNHWLIASIPVKSGEIVRITSAPRLFYSIDHASPVSPMFISVQNANDLMENSAGPLLVDSTWFFPSDIYGSAYDFGASDPAVQVRVSASGSFVSNPESAVTAFELWVNTTATTLNIYFSNYDTDLSTANSASVEGRLTVARMAMA